jgi:hypothetical protein
MNGLAGIRCQRGLDKISQNLAKRATEKPPPKEAASYSALLLRDGEDSTAYG